MANTFASYAAAAETCAAIRAAGDSTRMRIRSVTVTGGPKVFVIERHMNGRWQ